MNLAFGALVITLLVIPGAIFITLYRSGSRDIPSVSASFQENLALYLIVAIPIHLALTCVYSLFRIILHFLKFDLPIIRYDLAIRLIGGSEINREVELMFASYTWHILIYILISFISAVLTAFYARQLVRDYLLDIIYPVIRPNSAWYYFFTGEQQAMDKAAQEIKSINVEFYRRFPDTPQ